MHRVLCHSRWITSLLAWLQWSCLNTPAQTPLTIADFHLDAAGKAALRVPYAPGSYFILYRGNVVTEIREPTALEDRPLPLNSTQTELTDERPPVLAPTRFYRVERVSLSTPKDVDGDGLDDAYELRYRPLLNPLDPADARFDPDNDSRDTLAEYRAGTDPFTANPPPPPATPTLAPPPDATSSSLLSLTGTGPADTYVRVEGGAALATNNVRIDGTFELTVPLSPNRLNRRFVTAVNSQGETSAGRPVEVLQDSQPPTAFIDVPTAGASLTDAKVLVAGRVGDSLSGYRGLRVWVHSAPTEGDAPLATTQFPPDSPLSATVDVGIGPNGTYERGDVPLAEGANTITVIAADLLGNRTIRRVEITRRPLERPRLVALSGDRQTTTVRRRLAEPLVVRAQQADGAPLASAILLFEVTRSDGRLLPVNETQLAVPWSNSPNATVHGAMKLQLRTDAAGEARVWWTLGSDAGCANNRVSVTSTGANNSVFFCASATANPARQLNIGSGSNQKVEAGAATPEPLRVWASDGLNPAIGTPVTFRVVSGGGNLTPGGRDGTANVPAETQAREMVVTTGLTGHASVGFIAGPTTGQSVIEASFLGQFGLPARFIVYGLARDPSRPGSFSGLVLDNTSCPIGNATSRLTVANFDQTVMSDRQGRFRFENVPGGRGHLFVNGATATSLFTNSIPTNSFPSLSYSVVTVPNAENSLPTPVLLPRLNPKNSRVYDGTTDLVLTCEGIEGLKMTIQANSMSHPDGTRVTPERPAVVSLNQVHHDDVPMPMPDGVAPPFAWTFQPGGAHFDAERPVKVEYPNMSGLPPGAVAYFLSFNHDTERFEIVASGHVTEDGSTIVTDPGSGLTLSGWGCNCPPYSVTGDCSSCEPASAQGVGLQDNGASCESCDPTVPTPGGVPDFVPKDPGSCVSELTCACGTPCVLGCTTPFFEPGQPEIKAYCDPTAGVWRNKIVAADVQIRQHINLGPFTDISGSLIQATTSCEELRRMVLDLQSQLNPPFDCTQVGQRTIYSSSSFVEAHEMAHALHHIERLTPAFFDLQVAIESLTVSMDEYASAAAAETAIKNIPAYGTAIRTFNEAIQQSIQMEKDAEPLNDEQITEAALAIARHVAARKSELGCPPPAMGPERIISSRAKAAPALAVHPEVEDAARADALPAAPIGAGTTGSFYSAWTVSVNGQAVSTGTFRAFTIANISAVDVFGVEPGSAPDFVGDDLVRVIAVSSAQGENRYASSSFFRIRQGARVQAPPLTISSVPPKSPESLRLVSNSSVLTMLGAATPLQVIAAFPDGSTEERNSAAAGTTFRVSNPAIATVDANGVLTARMPGTVFITASNEGTTAVTQITVAPGDQLTTVVGSAMDAAGAPLAGAEVIVRAGDFDVRSVTGADGAFTIREVPASLGPLFVTVVQQRPDGRSIAVAKDIAVQAGAETRVPALTVQPFALTPRADLAGGASHTVALHTDRSLWAWGDGSFGQLGIGGQSSVEEPMRVGADADWVRVACGGNHTVAIKTDGSLWAFGQNSFGQLGTGGFGNAATPVRIGVSKDWQSVSGGATHTAALKSDGTLWTWGGNERGQLGLGDRSGRNAPVQLGSASDWLQVAAGQLHTAVLRMDGSLWTWGANNNNPLGDGTNADRDAPAQVGTDKDWITLAAGAQHAVALKRDGSLWAWGLNNEGQCGLGAFSRISSPTRIGADDDWVAVACGEAHTLALKADGSLWGFGRGTLGQLGNGSDQAARIPVRIGAAFDWLAVACGGNHTLGLKVDRSLWSWGAGSSGQLGNHPVASVDVPTALGADMNWQAISAGESHTLLRKTDGSLWALGYNVNGQLGLGNLLSTAIPSRVGGTADWAWISAGAADGRHSLALKTSGSLWSWGWNRDAQLGLGDRVDIASPVQVGSSQDWMSVASGRRHSIALKRDGSLWGWGANTFGQVSGEIFADPSTPMQIGTERDWSAAACGENYTVALKTDGSLYAWGYNLDGRLGLGDSRVVFGPTRIGTDRDWRLVVSGPRHPVALKTSGSLWAWGNNNHGQLGDGTLQNANAPKQIGTDSDWEAVACGAGHTVAVEQTGTLWAWGFNFEGQLGIGSRTDSSTPLRIGAGTQWRAVAAGGDFTLALRSDGALFGWGDNSRGQIGQPVPWLPRPVAGGNNWGL
jgi:alpha-tubulin suppressor-like RCC1 family protein